MKFLQVVFSFLLILCLPKEKKHTQEREEYFIDSLQIGRKGFNKVALSHFKADESFVEIKFYSKKGKEWILKNDFRFEKDYVTACDPVLEDFNNDQNLDFTYISGVAARGANEVRRLFIYDTKTDALILIKNAESFPNLMYNKKLNCVDSHMFHGGTTTVFLKIESDSLHMFASVNNDNEQVVTVYDKQGNGTEVSRKPLIEDDIYFRYTTFNPPDF